MLGWIKALWLVKLVMGLEQPIRVWLVVYFFQPIRNLRSKFISEGPGPDGVLKPVLQQTASPRWHWIQRTFNSKFCLVYFSFFVVRIELRLLRCTDTTDVKKFVSNSFLVILFTSRHTYFGFAFIVILP